jgi:hypothetical protein
MWDFIRIYGKAVTDFIETSDKEYEIIRAAGMFAGPDYI